jgi:SPP1 gp7 family putative phage head morphogenesis protein
LLLSLDRVETAEERRQREREEFNAEREYGRAYNAQRSYGASLRQYAKVITRIIEHHAEGTPPIVPPHRMPELNYALERYRAASIPWASRTAARMLYEVDRRNKTAWMKNTQKMGLAIRQELVATPVGATVESLLALQVDLITSLPTDAAARVQEASMAALTTGARYPEREAEIEAALRAAHPDDIGNWMKSRATLIARTETARSASVLTQARAEYIGSTHYIWKTAGDARVRENHRKLNNTTQAWADPPESDPPLHSHPGQIWNCRCLAIPVIAG